MKWDENYHDYAASVQSDKCGASLNLIDKMEKWWARVLKKMGHHSVM